jgi:UDPglucose 6-dehydrogenase
MYVIAGFGYVGSALYETAATRCGIPHFVIDPKYSLDDNQPFTTWDMLAGRTDIEGIIVCVSTPQGLDGRCDTGNVHDVLRRATRLFPRVPILIKSTVSLEGWETIKGLFPKSNISYSPEFLKADTAKEDFANQDFVIVGSEFGLAPFWFNYFRKMFPKASLFSCSAEEAIMIKYASNCFLAVKVSFFNHIYDLCQKQGLDYDIVRGLLTMRDDIGKNHTAVTEQRGWGGYCFPKDTAAMLHTCKLLGYNFATLKAAVDYNWSIRDGVLDTKDELVGLRDA